VIDHPTSREAGRLGLGDRRDAPDGVRVRVDTGLEFRIVVVEEQRGEHRQWRWEVRGPDGRVFRRGSVLWWSAGDAYAGASDALGLRYDLETRDALREYDREGRLRRRRRTAS
jgi:hypothetical protein